MRPLRKACLSVAAASGTLRAMRQLTAERPRILAYHGVTDRLDDPLNFDGFFVAASVFEAHLRTLAHHYRVVPLADLVACVRQRSAFAPRSVSLTFDDGYLNNAEIAAPLLARHGLKATFFITTDFIDGTHQPWWFQVREGLRQTSAATLANAASREEAVLKNLPDAERLPRVSKWEAPAARVPAMMTWDHVRALHAAGHEIGVHTVSHPSMGHEDRERLDREVREASARIRAECGVQPTLFAYPYGGPANRSPASRAALEAGGIAGAVTTDERWVSLEDDPLALPRINVSGGMDRLTFRARLAGMKRSDATRPQPGGAARK